mmetsp:Transcript_34692/g.53191  ORF Transcript_34692/g.53191 Transcript_34692/m.53191 type:complete len:141 (+) Transcript_34692:1325-1747(+)
MLNLQAFTVNEITQTDVALKVRVKAVPVGGRTKVFKEGQDFLESSFIMRLSIEYLGQYYVGKDGSKEIETLRESLLSTAIQNQQQKEQQSKLKLTFYLRSKIKASLASENESCYSASEILGNRYFVKLYPEMIPQDKEED